MSIVRKGPWSDLEDLKLLRQTMKQHLNGKAIDYKNITIEGRTECVIKDRSAAVKKECMAEDGKAPAADGDGDNAVKPAAKKRAAPAKINGAAKKKTKTATKKAPEPAEDEGDEDADDQEEEDA